MRLKLNFALLLAAIAALAVIAYQGRKHEKDAPRPAAATQQG
jgi:hypothetical protein